MVRRSAATATSPLPWRRPLISDPLTAEYFCFADDWLWKASDADLIGLAQRELDSMKLLSGAVIVDAFVIRSPKPIR